MTPPGMKSISKKMNLDEVEAFAAPIVRAYLTQNNYDGEKIKKSEPIIGTLIEVKGKNIFTVELYIPAERPENAIVFVSVDINTVTKEYTVIPGASAELERYKQ